MVLQRNTSVSFIDLAKILAEVIEELCLICIEVTPAGGVHKVHGLVGNSYFVCLYTLSTYFVVSMLTIMQGGFEGEPRSMR